MTATDRNDFPAPAATLTRFVADPLSLRGDDFAKTRALHHTVGLILRRMLRGDTMTDAVAAYAACDVVESDGAILPPLRRLLIVLGLFDDDADRIDRAAFAKGWNSQFPARDAAPEAIGDAVLSLAEFRAEDGDWPTTPPPAADPLVDVIDEVEAEAKSDAVAADDAATDPLATALDAAARTLDVAKSGGVDQIAGAFAAFESALADVVTPKPKTPRQSDPLVAALDDVDDEALSRTIVRTITDRERKPNRTGVACLWPDEVTEPDWIAIRETMPGTGLVEIGLTLAGCLFLVLTPKAKAMPPRDVVAALTAALAAARR